MARKAHGKKGRRPACGRLRAAVRIVTLAFALITCYAAMTSSAEARTRSTDLRVVITGLPPTTAAKVTLRGSHGYVRRVARSEVLSHVPAGRFVVAVERVPFHRTYRGVPAGSEAFPSKSRITVVAAGGRTTVVDVSYGTVRSARVLVLKKRPLAVTGPATAPTAILLARRAAVGIGVGTILDQAPSAKLPSGLFDRVVSVRRRHRGVLVALKPALLAEAFPAFEVDTSVPFSFGSPPVGEGAHTASFLDDVDLSYSVPLIPDLLEVSCGGPPTGWSFTPSGSVRATLNPNMHRGFLGLVYGELTVSVTGNVGFAATIPSGVHCGFTVDGPSAEAVIPIAGVPVPVEGAFDLNVTLALTSDAHVTASAGATVETGLELHGVYATPILRTRNRTASGSVSGNGVKVTIGPEVQAGIGTSDINAHVDGSIFIAGKTSSSGCEVDIGASAGLGLDFLTLHAAYTPFEGEVPIYHCPPPASPPQLQISQTGPPGAFPGQSYDYTIRVTNTGGTTAEGVQIQDTLAGEGAFVSSSLGGSPAAPAAGGTLAIPLGSLAPGQSKTEQLWWTAPDSPTTLRNTALATASNTGPAGPAVTAVSVGTTGNCNPCGAASAGTGLRNRNRGVITIEGIPPGATVTQAVLVWGILYAGEVPTNEITFQGHRLAANLTSNVSGDLCWGDEATVGYAADVTPYVTGDGTFEVTEPPNGEVRVDESPYGPLPYTDGASLIVFYDGGGADNQVLSNFSYNTNTDPATGEAITRTFEGIHSVGGPASLTLAGPDGQNNYGKVFTFSGAGEFQVENPFDGGAPQEGPSFPIGNLWDNESFDVSPILPAGQGTLAFDNQFTEDCVGVSAAVLQVAQ